MFGDETPMTNTPHPAWGDLVEGETYVTAWTKVFDKYTTQLQNLGLAELVDLAGCEPVDDATNTDPWKCRFEIPDVADGLLFLTQVEGVRAKEILTRLRDEFQVEFHKQAELDADREDYECEDDEDGEIGG